MDGKTKAVEAGEDQDVEDELFNNPFGTLVKNCNMLHNIVGPACIFLKQGFSQTLVCNRIQSVQTSVESFSSIHKHLPPHQSPSLFLHRPTAAGQHTMEQQVFQSMEIIDSFVFSPAAGRNPGCRRLQIHGWRIFSYCFALMHVCSA